LEKITGRKLPLAALFQAPTIEHLAGVLRQEGWQPSWSSLVPIKPNGLKPPFYCVHGVGGNILEFEHFSRYIDPDQPLYGLQAQGLDGKKPRHSSVEEMAAHYIKEIREFQPQGPYYLGGSSFGGLVAYEMAQQFRAAGDRVGLLVLFDTNAPGYPVFVPTMTSFRRKLRHARFRFELHWSNIRVAEPAIRREYIRAKTERFIRQYRVKTGWALKGLLRKVEHRLMPKEIRDVQKSGLQANKSYSPKPYEGVVTLFRAAEQPYDIVPDPSNGWSGFAAGGLEIHEIPGHHGAIMREPRARDLVRTLTRCLRAAQEESPVKHGNGRKEQDSGQQRNHRL
jgi:thioesterase domain-containing protein